MSGPRIPEDVTVGLDQTMDRVALGDEVIVDPSKRRDQERGRALADVVVYTEADMLLTLFVTREGEVHVRTDQPIANVVHMLREILRSAEARQAGEQT